MPESYSRGHARRLCSSRFTGAGAARPAQLGEATTSARKKEAWSSSRRTSRASTWDLIIFGGYGPDVAFLDEALEHTFERCRIDPAQIAMGGFSDGASYALSLGVSNGDLLSHLIGYSPGFHAPSDPIVGKPRVFISHGDPGQHSSCEQHSGTSSCRAFADADYDVKYEEFAGGHEVPAEISESALDWFLGD